VDKPASIVYLIDHIWSGHGGTEGQLLQLIAGLDRQRFQPRLIVLYGHGDLVGSGRLPCPCRCLHLVSGRQPRYWKSLAHVAGILRRDRPTLLHSIFPESVTAGPWLARLAGVPHVTWRRDLGFWLTPVKRRLLRLVSRWTRCCVANSEAVRDQVIRDEGFRPQQVAVVRNAVDMIELAEVAPLDVAHVLNLPADTLIIAFPANLRPVKGGDIVLQALAGVRAAGAPVHLVSIGENSRLLAKYEQRCDRLGIKNAVTFLGHRPREELLRWVRGSDVVLNASFSEGYCNSNVEAMLMSRPLIATAVGGNLEQVVDQETGILVPSGDADAMAAAILRLYHDEHLRSAFGSSGARRMQQLHGVNEAVQRHESLYETILARGGPNHAG
jgi:L-malate glycosyltransferase